MATVTVTPGYNWVSGEVVTPAKMNLAAAPTATVSTIVAADIAADSITTVKILDANVTNAKIASGVDAAKLTTGTLPADRIASGAITTAKINAAAITADKLAGAQTGAAPIYGVRAWVNFDGLVDDNLTGTYSRSGTDVTVTAAGHGVLVGHKVRLDFTGGTPTAAVDGLYTVTVVDDANNFHVITTLSGTSSGGSVTLLRRQIRASGNVATVTYNNEVGVYTVNFATALPDSDYALAGFANFSSSAAAGIVTGNSTHSQTSLVCDVRVANSTSGGETSVSQVHVMFIR
jgi:hypothetical protein